MTRKQHIDWDEDLPKIVNELKAVCPKTMRLVCVKAGRKSVSRVPSSRRYSFIGKYDLYLMREPHNSPIKIPRSYSIRMNLLWLFPVQKVTTISSHYGWTRAITGKNLSKAQSQRLLTQALIELCLTEKEQDNLKTDTYGRYGSKK